MRLKSNCFHKLRIHFPVFIENGITAFIVPMTPRHIQFIKNLDNVFIPSVGIGSWRYTVDTELSAI